jgi:hypothetical protein
MYSRRNGQLPKSQLTINYKGTFTLAKFEEEMRLKMQLKMPVTMTVAVFFLSPGVSSDG